MSDLLNTKAPREEQWIYIADMMAGLMIVFLFISIVLIEDIDQRYGQFNSIRTDICVELRNSLETKEKKWGMSICEDGELLIRFPESVTFEEGKSELTDRFKKILDEFLPKFMGVIYKYEESISELRIEGHTNSRGKRNQQDRLEIYLFNTDLSQNRSYSVLRYVLKNIEVSESDSYLGQSYARWTAHGLSSSKILTKNGREDFEASRRVEFRIKLKEEDKVLELINGSLKENFR